MVRSVFLILGGAVTGTCAVLLVLGLPSEDASSYDPDIGTDAVTLNESMISDGGEIAVPDPFDTSLAALESVAESGDADGPELELERLVALEATSATDAAIDALLNQIAAADPRRAVELALRLELGEERVTEQFRVWASRNPDAALDELGNLTWPYMQRSVALALLDVYGVNGDGIDRVAAAFGPVEAASFRIDAIGRLAEDDLVAALAAADALEISQAQSAAQQRIASVMGGINPQLAMEYAGNIEMAILRQRYMDELLDTWAKLDPAAMLEYMKTIDLSEMIVSNQAFHALAVSSPEQLLALAESFAPAQRNQAEIAALAVLASLEPTTAYNRILSLPPSGNRNDLIARVAQQYADQDPEAAMAWAANLEPRSPAALSAVLSLVATDNPLRVADVVIQQIVDPIAANRGEMLSLAGLFSGAMQARSPEIARIADTLATHSDPRVQAQLRTMMTLWPQTDPDAAAEWAMRNPSRMTPGVAGNFARLLAAENPALAAQGLQRVPANSRAEWIEGAASGMARNDVTYALNWVDDFRGQPVYESAVTAVLTNAAGTDPALVATRLTERPDMLSQLAPMVASSWALSDARAATSWVRDLPQGDARDRGLAGLIEGTAARGELDESLFEEFSSDEARANGVMSTLFALGREDPQRARRLIEQHISNPAMRQQAERQLDAMASLPSNVATILRNMGAGTGSVIVGPDGSISVR